MKKINLAILSSSLVAIPFVSASCAKNVKTVEKIKQDNLIKADAAEQLKAKFTRATLLSLYKIKFNDSNNLDETYLNEFKKEESDLFKDSEKAFKLYAKNKLDKDKYYFAQKVVDWTSSRILNNQEIETLKTIQPHSEITKDHFKALWLNEKTGIRAEIEKMLFVNKYFAINTKEELKKIDKNFKYTKDIKYELKNYLLAKYAVEKKYAQIWMKDAETKVDNDSFFTRGFPTIKDADTFNEFWKDSSQPKDQLKADIEFISENEDDKKLYGYKGFKSATTSYSLKWDYESLKNKKAKKDLYGYFDVNNNRLVNSEIENGFVINPYKISTGENTTPTVVYLNQIAPIAASQEVELPNSEDAQSAKSKVTLLSFDNTMYKDKLDILAFLFFLNDQTLYETAIKSFADLGYKIKINKTSIALREAAKSLVFVELV